MNSKCNDSANRFSKIGSEDFFIPFQCIQTVAREKPFISYGKRVESASSTY